MSKYKILRESYGKASAEEKLQILRNEMMTPIAVIRGYTALLKKELDSGAEKFPQNFNRWVSAMTVAGNDLHEILEAMTGSKDQLTDK